MPADLVHLQKLVPNYLHAQVKQLGAGRRLLAQALANRSGTAALEFAIILPVIVTLLIGMFDYGALAYQTMEVSTAAHAGAEYALKNGFTASAVQTAVTSATTLTVTASPAPTLEKACVTSGAIVVTAGSSCSSGGAPGSYVLVYAQAPFSPIISWASFIMPSRVAAQAMVRIQ